ncbi:hypothetical protein GS397_06735 [Sphingobium yanoikuyae]|nr:hypothetical protein [Sphingobium yanoikuyae]QHD66770.1 hypothetical protein GS397_06735 [Sphingobium yanoikuyae]QNG43840.1 hypothetical protein H3V42_18110 [Sphingobium yanoikuyae]
MEGIYQIGTRIYHADPDRLFAHQFGDGFIIVADFHEPQLDRCAAIAIALMRHVSGARPAIAEGAFADISGLWPMAIQAAAVRDGADDRVALGSGIMTLLPVMGTALIAANKLDAKNPVKGSILTVASANSARISSAFQRQDVATAKDVTIIDWVHTEHADIERMLMDAGVGRSAGDAEKAVRDYAVAEKPPFAWIDGTFSYNNIT